MVHKELPPDVILEVADGTRAWFRLFLVFQRNMRRFIFVRKIVCSAWWRLFCWQGEGRMVEDRLVPCWLSLDILCPKQP